MDRIERMLEKLQKLKKKDRTFQIFGAVDHRYALREPLVPEDVEEFESEHGIRLPPEYRNFLLKAGGCGAGPFYGLLELTDSDTNKADPSSPFPFTVGAPCDLRAYREPAERPDPDEDDEEKAAREQRERERVQRIEQQIGADLDDAVKGVVILCHEGCGMFNILVVNGEEYGKVWWLDFANDVGAFPLAHPDTGKALGFWDWYELWLDRSLSALKSGEESFFSYSEFLMD